MQIMAEQADSEPMRQMASSLSKTYAANGAPAMLRQYAALQAQSGGSSSAFFSAQAFAFAGDETKALENLELSASRHEWAVLYMNSFPEFKSLRDLPRFQAIKQRIELD
jgi:hypothetical protein